MTDFRQGNTWGEKMGTTEGKSREIDPTRVARPWGELLPVLQLTGVICLPGQKEALSGFRVPREV